MSKGFTLFVANTAAANQAAKTTATQDAPAVKQVAADAKDAATAATTEQAANPAAAAVPENTSESGGLMTFLPMILIIVVMFYLMYRGQKKEQKRRQEMISSVKKGNKVVTIGGIHGTIFEVKEDTFVITIAANTNIEVGKAAVATIVPETTTIEAAQK